MDTLRLRNSPTSDLSWGREMQKAMRQSWVSQVRPGSQQSQLPLLTFPWEHSSRPSIQMPRHHLAPTHPPERRCS
jgi:hypothetical protein